MATRSCEVCLSLDAEFATIRVGLVYLICRSCGHALLEVSEQSLYERFLASQDKYFGDASSIAEGCLNEHDLMRKRQEVFDRFVNKPAEVLEVGPGGGAFLCWAEGGGHRVTAVEDSQALADVLRTKTDAHIHVGRFESSMLPDASQDVFCSFHVIEHVVEPRLHFQEAARVVREGGLAIIATPNGTSWQQRLFRTLSPNFDSAHLRVFSQKSLVRLANDTGWDVVWQETPEYMSAWLRVISKAVRKIRGEDEEATAGKYGARFSRRNHPALNLLEKVTFPLRVVQSRLHGGNEILVVLRRSA